MLWPQFIKRPPGRIDHIQQSTLNMPTIFVTLFAPTIFWIVQNFLPGTLEKMGLGFADLAAINPGHTRTIVLSIQKETKHVRWSMYIIELLREEMHPSM